MKPILTIIFSVILVVFVSNAIAGEYHYFATDDEPLYGTWINDKYDINPSPKLVYNSDGTGGAASMVDAEKLQYKIRYLITGKWKDDDGNIMYKGHWIGDWQNGEGFSLYKISNSGNTLEYVFDHKYPKKLHPGHANYRKYTRKK